jgi:nitrite reductase/ring-hydroxylating ferredoxin subunit
MTKHVVARVDEVPEGDHIVVEVAGRSIGIFRLDGEFHGLLNRCPHRQGPMCSGRVVSELFSDAPGTYRVDEHRRLIACPWHGWEFDIKTGRSYVDPQRIRIRRFPVHVEPGEHLVAGPYNAERVPVRREGDYLVIETP